MIILPKRHGLEEGIEWPRSSGVFGDDKRKDDLYRHHGYTEQGQAVPVNSLLYQLETRHRISRSKSYLKTQSIGNYHTSHENTINRQLSHHHV